MFYSKSTGGFYTREIHGDNIPADAVEITDAEHAALIEGQSQGKRMVANDRGFPIAIDPPTTPFAELLERAKAELRTMRAPMLDALTGIAGRAVRAGNDALAAEADALAELLMEITDDPALNAATTYEEMQAAGVAAYKRIAGSVSQELKVVFREITGV